MRLNMADLSAEHLESIRRLLLEPLRETVKSEIQRSHDRLESALDQLADRIDAHIQRSEKRVTAIEREVIGLRSFRHRIVAVYGVLTVLLSLLWSIVRDKLLARFAGGCGHLCWRHATARHRSQYLAAWPLSYIACRFIMPAAWSRSHLIPGRLSRSVNVLHMASVGPEPMSQPLARAVR